MHHHGHAAMACAPAPHHGAADWAVHARAEAGWGEHVAAVQVFHAAASVGDVACCPGAASAGVAAAQAWPDAVVAAVYAGGVVAAEVVRGDGPAASSTQVASHSGCPSRTSPLPARHAGEKVRGSGNPHAEVV